MIGAFLVYSYVMYSTTILIGIGYSFYTEYDSEKKFKNNEIEMVEYR